MIHAALIQFKIRCNLRVVFLGQICTPKTLEFTKTNVFSQSGQGGINSKYDYGQRFTVCLIFLFTLSLTSSNNLSYSLYQNKSLTTKNPHNFHKNCTTNGFQETCSSLFILYVICHMSFVRCQLFFGRSCNNVACPF